MCLKAFAARARLSSSVVPPWATASAIAGVRRGLDDDGDGGVVLGRRADHRGAADVDLLDHVVGRSPRGHSRGERIQVNDDEVEGLDAQVRELVAVRLEAPVGKDARVNAWVQRLDPAVEALGEARQVLNRA